MTWFFVLFGTIMLFGGIIVLLDWLAERKEHQTERQP